MTYVIRPAEPADVDSIVELVRALADYERAPDAAKMDAAACHDALFGPHPAAFALIAEEADGSATLGFALYFHNFSTWTGRRGVYLEDLFVRPEQRGRGIGRALLARCAAIAVAGGCPRLDWAVLDWNRPSRDFYESLDARPMQDWIPYRLTGDALRRLAETA